MRKHYLKPACRAYHLEPQTLLCGSADEAPRIEIIDEGRISRPQNVFSSRRPPSIFEPEE